MYEFFDAKRVVIVDVPDRRDAAREGEYRRGIEMVSLPSLMERTLRRE